MPGRHATAASTPRATRSTRCRTRVGATSPGTVCRILGEVVLWGHVLETEGGWRASHAYPARLYVADAEIARRARAAIACPVCASLSSRTCTATPSRSALRSPTWRTRKPDLIVSLGDVAQGGPQPRECVELLRELGCPCVFGNSDEFLLTLDLGAEEAEDVERLLDDGALVARAARRARASSSCAASSRRCRPVACCAVTRRRRRTRTSSCRRRRRRRSAALDADAVAAGHVHQQWLRRFDRTLWFCVGAIGVARWCEYALVDDETLAVEFRRIPFDLDELLAAARAKDFPHFDRGLECSRRRVRRRLRLGRGRVHGTLLARARRRRAARG